MDNTGPDRELFGIASAVVSIQKLIIVLYDQVSRKHLFSQKASGTFQKHLRLDLKNVTNCLLVLPFLPPGCLLKWNLAGKFVNFDLVCTAAP